MPAGWGDCPTCCRFAWLPAGPVTMPCVECAADRVITAASRAVDAELADDPAEIVLRGELP